jgi:TolB protein
MTVVTLFAVDAKLTIEKDVDQRTRIGILDASIDDARNIYDIFVGDLKLSGHFLPKGDYEKSHMDRTLAPSHKAYEYVLKYVYDDFDGAVLDVLLVRTADGKVVFKKRYAVKHTAKMPFLVHKAVYDINKLLRYPDIGWINRYVLYSRYVAPRKTEIGVADYTFTFVKPVIRGGYNLFPKWADRSQRAFYYTSLSGVLPTLYRLDIYNGRRKKIASSQGMIVCSDVSKDGERLLLTMAPQGQPDIYEMRIRSGMKRRITHFSGIDVGGHYAGQAEDQVVFVSNRLGYPNIFKKGLNGGAVVQVVYRGRKNNACDAYAERIVYASRESDSPFGRNKFNIYLSDLYGSQTRPLTTTGGNLSPHFSQDGSLVAYIKRDHKTSRIGYVNIGAKTSALFRFPYGKLQTIDW